VCPTFDRNTAAGSTCDAHVLLADGHVDDCLPPDDATGVTGFSLFSLA
jgi:prepilin-type processing-associated H-X9-DG protein